MLVNAVIIILREVLEAALLVSIMLSLSHYFKIPLGWLKYSLGLGLGSAFLYANNIETISALFEGVGQEVLNASMQILIYILLAGFSIYIIRQRSLSARSLKVISWIMGISISLSMVREFSEILIYLQVFSSNSQQFSSVMIGSFLGVGIGLSIGTIFYHLLNYLRDKGFFNSTIIVLSFIAAGMLSQATQLLIQADWLPSQQPLWDSSAWISERSVVGQLLYALFGYEATPSLIQVCFYLTGLFIILFFVFMPFRLNYSEPD